MAAGAHKRVMKTEVIRTLLFLWGEGSAPKFIQKGDPAPRLKNGSAQDDSSRPLLKIQIEGVNVVCARVAQEHS